MLLPRAIRQHSSPRVTQGDCRYEADNATGTTQECFCNPSVLPPSRPASGRLSSGAIERNPHPSWLAPKVRKYGSWGKERISLYVPEDLAPEVEKALENGRELQALINEAGTRYLHARKRERRRKAGEK